MRDTPVTERAQTARAVGLAARVDRGFRVPLPRLSRWLARPARRLSAAPGLAAGMLLAAGGCSSPSPARPDGTVVSDCLTRAQCYDPHQFRVAYGIQPLLDHGIDGRGQTVVLPEFAATAPASLPRVTDIRQDLADFDSRFGLPPARIQVITTLAGSSASKWLASVEEAVDTEMVHAVAPDATIRELLVARADVDTPAKEAATFATQVRIAASHADVISLSGAYGEHFVTPAEVATVNSALEYSAARPSPSWLLRATAARSATWGHSAPPRPSRR